MTETQRLFVAQVYAERDYQRQKWGTGELQHDPVEWAAILAAEVGEFAQAALGKPSLDERHTVESELVQIAAVAMAAYESLEALK